MTDPEVGSVEVECNNIACLAWFSGSVDGAIAWLKLHRHDGAA